MKVTQILPDDYREVLYLDMNRDTKTRGRLALVSFGVMVLMTVGMSLLRPIRALFDMDGGLMLYILRFVVLIASYMGYVVLHERVHGAAMKMLKADRVRFGWTGMYPWAGSEIDHFDRGAYTLVALSPLAVFLLLLGILCLILPPDWFWVAYLLQVINICVSVRDLYVLLRISRIRGPVLVRETGMSTTVYSESREGPGS